MQRVLIVGCPGAGKSTFAQRLGERVPLPVIHLDLHFWHHGWEPSEPQEWRDRVAVLAAARQWIMDGNYHGTYDLRMPRADTLIWLDYPRHRCLFRVIKRIAMDHGRTRPDLPDGCPEKFDLEFLRFVWDFPKQTRPHTPEGIARYGRHLRVERFLHDREANAYLAALSMP